MTAALLREVLVQWQGGASLRAIARATSVDRKTVRRYVAVLRAMRRERWMRIDDDVVQAVASVMRRRPLRVTQTQHALLVRRERIRTWLSMRMKLSRIHAALVHEGVRVSYATLRRFAIAELGWRARTLSALAA